MNLRPSGYELRLECDFGLMIAVLRRFLSLKTDLRAAFCPCIPHSFSPVWGTVWVRGISICATINKEKALCGERDAIY